MTSFRGVLAEATQRPRIGVLASRPVLLAALTVVVGVDVLIVLLDPSYPAIGVFDESAHAATAVLVLANLAPRSRGWVAGFAVGAVGIDLDHLPQLLGSDVITEGTGRPYPHSLLTLGVLVGVAGAGARLRDVALGAALGVATHLARDLATGGAGVALFWPLSEQALYLPYPLYLVLIVALAVRAWWALRPGVREGGE